MARLSFTRILIALCLIVLSGCRIGAQNRVQFPLPDLTIPDALGVNPHMVEPAPGELDRIRDAGFRWIRTDFAWTDIEQKRGEYDFSRYDKLLDGLSAAHMRAILIFDSSNPLYEKNAPSTPEARAACARWAAATVTRYKNRGVLWEIWNEPNGDFWKPKPSVKDYAALVVEVGKAIRQAAPDEWYVGPALAGIDPEDVRWLDGCFKAGLLQYWDAVTVHPYRDGDPESAAPTLQRIQSMIARYSPPGKRIPLLDGEWGYSACRARVTPDRQAAYLPRMALVGLMNGVGLTEWYDWRDDGTNPNNIEHHFGIFLQDGNPKLVYYALKRLAKELDGYRFEKRLDLASSDDYCLLFSKGESRRLAVWTRGAVHKVAIQAGKGAFEIIDDTGSRTQAEVGASGLDVTLTEHPQYIIPHTF
jgi:hypothetical protein